MGLKVEGFAEGGGHVQYRRVEVERCIRRVAAEGFAEVFSRMGTAEKGPEGGEGGGDLTDKIKEP